MSSCRRCCRPEWDVELDGALDGSRCTHTDGPECLAVARGNCLAAALRALAREPSVDTTRRVALAILDKYAPGGHECPLCHEPFAVRNGQVTIHFAKPTDQRPCSASFRRVLGGVLCE